LVHYVRIGESGLDRNAAGHLVNPLNEAGAGLVVDKGGAIISNTANSFGGPVTISAGTFVAGVIADAGVASGLGQGASAITVNGGSLQLGGETGATNCTVNLSGDGSVGAANLTSLLDLTGTVTGPIIKVGPGAL
jgi:autotransporter-associated beta strand protein